ncbi:hypothetical protein F4678DRAFT_408405 [Xylaria arbuscula]|nr:hypothetical protein F4678DRAFT_408405 [Xylaria arbuscula]
MTNTLLHYLTVRNPETVQHGSRGKSTETRKRYGPDKKRPWEDMTLENLQMAFGDVLLEEMILFEPKDASEIPADIYTEQSVRKLAGAWIEHIVQPALGGTYKALCRDHYTGPLTIGQLKFTDNDGRGDLIDEGGNWHRPDWMVYLDTSENYTVHYSPSGSSKTTVPNLIPGDCKPSMKWKSEWLNCSDESRRGKAEWVLRQVAKYMHLGKTRYSFILSDEELVPVRLSTYKKNPATAVKQMRSANKENVVELNTSFVDSDSEDDGPRSDLSRISSERDPDGSFADESRDTGYILEWCSIPWANTGDDNLTINLALWWLCVLATQGTSVKGYGTYTPLGEMVRGCSPETFDLPKQSKEGEETERPNLINTNKRAADEHDSDDDSVKRPRTRSRTLSRLDNAPLSPPLTRSSRTRTASQRTRDITATESRPNTSQTMPSPSLRRSKRQTSTPHMSYNDDSSSENTIEYDDPIHMSFMMENESTRGT